VLGSITAPSAGELTSSAPIAPSTLTVPSRFALRVTNLYALLGLGRLRWLRQWFLRRVRRIHRGFLRRLRRLRRLHQGFLQRLRRLRHRGGWFLRRLRRLRRGHRWCRRGFAEVTLWCARRFRPGCDHGLPATGVHRLIPRPRRNAGAGMAARGFLLGPPAATVRCRPARHRSSRVNRRELGQPLRGIAARAEREPGQLPRGTAAGGAGEQLDQDRHPANQDRRYPCDPHGHQAGQPGMGRALHDDRSVVAISSFGAGGLLPRDGEMATPQAATAQLAKKRNGPPKRAVPGVLQGGEICVLLFVCGR
jgi:hypothetical protein